MLKDSDFLNFLNYGMVMIYVFYKIKKVRWLFFFYVFNIICCKFVWVVWLYKGFVEENVFVIW